MYYLVNLTFSTGTPFSAERVAALNPRESINHSNFFLPLIKNHTQA